MYSWAIRAATLPIWRGPSVAPNWRTTSAYTAPGDLGKWVIKMDFAPRWWAMDMVSRMSLVEPE